MAIATEPEDYEQILRTLTDAGLPYFVEGGQAVNIWAEYFASEERSLEEFRPYTSKDCDLWIGAVTFDRLRKGLLTGDGKLVVGNSPADGQLGVFTLKGLPERAIDLMQGVYGIPPTQMERAYRRSVDLAGVRVLDPLFLFKGKCHNLVKLNQRARQDEKHVRMLRLLLPVYFQFLLEKACSKEITQRNLINEIKLFSSFAKDGWVRQAMSKTSLNLIEMIPIESLKDCGLATVERYAKQTWPD